MGRTPTPKKPKLTVKETKLVQGIVKGKSQTQAAIDAGYSPRSAHEIASKTLKKVDVKQALDMALKRHGITLDTAIAPIGKALTAKKQNEFTGEITEDIQTQLKGSDRALKLMGIGQDKDNPATANFIQIINEKGSKYNV